MEKKEDLINAVYGLQFEPELLESLSHVGNYLHCPSGRTIMDIGQPFLGMPLVLSGAVKVMREDAVDNELLLYFLEPGDTCVMSFSGCMSKQKSKIRVVAEVESEILMIPVAYLNDWMCKYESWRDFVFDAVRIRMDEFVEAVDSLAFMRLDERLLKYLHDRARVLGTTELEVTHQEIASDLHTSRVVVSRLLKRLENQGVLQIQRNRLHLSSF